MRATLRWILPLLTLAGPALAQSSIRGVVRDTAGHPIPDAEVLVMAPERRVRTDSAGRYAIAGLAPGTYDVRARRLGYYLNGVKVVLGVGANKQLIIELVQRPVMLDTVNVTDNCGRWEFASFVCRRRSGNGGIFMDVDAIDSANARYVVDLFRRPGFRVELPAKGSLIVKPLTGWRCITTIVNGRPASPTNPPPSTPQELLGLEIYADPADVPKEYDGYAWGSIKAGRRTLPARCSLAIYWTSVRPRKG